MVLGNLKGRIWGERSCNLGKIGVLVGNSSNETSFVKDCDKFETMVMKQMDDLNNSKSLIRPLSSQYLNMRKKFIHKTKGLGSSFDIDNSSSKVRNTRYSNHKYAKGVGERIYQKRQSSKNELYFKNQKPQICRSFVKNRKKRNILNRTVILRRENGSFITESHTKLGHKRSNPRIKVRFKKPRMIKRKFRPAEKYKDNEECKIVVPKRKDARRHSHKRILSRAKRVMIVYGSDQLLNFHHINKPQLERARRKIRN
ncbi:unnamed protein product [Moneuplotes crassus]|uniref:Uncharacterized protein n=1 Tax=Euplotes crassus TaxID=5936 RepID=A0AAD1XR86_EUPCR|nr:unnamed protein product [Moneuplotes crassus]